jgi:cyclopropane fatty-acyl-phospholipid synthase-like methyltransferase
VLAVDNYPPFVEEVNRQAQRLGLADRLEARVADMRELDFPPASFDVVWCEGAVYNVGLRDRAPRVAPAARAGRTHSGH